MNLSRLTAFIESLRTAGPDAGQETLSPDPDITSVHYNSKDVKPGGLFVAVKGLKADGHRFIPDAVSRGASAIIAEQNISGTDVPVIRVTNSRKALALVSACFYNHPSQGMHITGVTGTNGKTSITYFLESMFKEAGFIPGVIGTINCRYAGIVIDNPMTTPDSLDLQRLLAEMKNAGVTHVVMEVSSHAVDLDRILGISFDTGVFTNLSQDHLDYHGTMEDYFACKKRFFTDYLSDSGSPKKQTSVINTADPAGCRLAGDIVGSVLTTGLPDADIRIENPQLDLKGIKGALVTPRGRIDIRSRVIGRHNMENILNASAAAIAADVPLDALSRGLETITVPGRLERIENKRGYDVFVDYAHTPDGLLNVLRTVRPLTTGRVITVFGCGGDRDRGKRPKMGHIAEEFSDLTLVTLDNPRTEDPGAIIADILAGMESHEISHENGIFNLSPGKNVHAVEPDRRTAIGYAIRNARPGDCVLIAGKGHETYQIFKDRTIDFDDRIEAGKALENNE